MNMTKKLWKNTAVAGLAMTMALGGATAAFADGKGHGHDKDRYESSKNNKSKSKGKGRFEININFNDVNKKELQWALKSIISLASKGVFNGYEDGTFQPNKTISRIEAITAAVRLMGLKEKAESQEEMSSELNFKDADKLEKKYPWAVGYVAVALENDLFAESEEMIQPEKAADRLWATTLLVKALKLEGDAKAKMNTKLTFKDAREIPAGSVGYVAVAIEKGLVKGYENNTFRPNQPVTRAELAALLDRTGEQMPDNTAIAGTLTAVNASALSIKKNDGTQVTLALDPNAFIFRGGVKSPANALVVGDEIVVRAYNNAIIFVDVTKPYTAPTTPPANVTFADAGKINSTTLNAQGRLATISIVKEVNGSTQVTIYNVADNVAVTGNASLLVPNQAVELKGSNQIVTSIEIK